MSQAGPSNYQQSEDSHICQRCHQPLILDPSIQNLTSSQYNLITSALPSSPYSESQLPVSSTNKLASLPPSSREAAKIWSESNHIPFNSSSTTSTNKGVAESFILLSDSSLLPPPHSHSHSHSHSNPSHPYTNPTRSQTQTQTQTQSQIPQNTNTNLVNQLHSILSSNTPISHPLCTECTALLTSEFQKLAEELTKERDAYINFEKNIQRNRDNQKSNGNNNTSKNNRKSTDVNDDNLKDDVSRPGLGPESEEGLGEFDIEGNEDEWDELIKRKSQLEEEEIKLKLILEQKEFELNKVKLEEEQVKKDEQDIEREETEYLLEHASLSTHLSHLKSELSTAQTHLLLSRSLLSHLESTNVYNDAFQIGHVPLDPSSGNGITVGTINGLRLGGRPTVDWEEINAAWGLTALCLDRIADKVGYTFISYKIVPLGSYSRIEELPPAKGVYELYASSDLSPARLLQNRRFNHAMVAILDCLKQLIEYGKKANKGWANNNIEIYKDKISGHSIKLPGISSMPLTLPSMSIMGLGSSSSSSSTANPSSSSTAYKDKSDNDSTAEEGWTKACRAVLVVLKRVLMVESQMDRGAVGR
ncbi:uncharacterized protein IL334_001121 [Kwoniella shivajii]|uniref:Autophagy-related protein 6 n=1 Tax=Kwoniella shivajii TaxID=564305 RepID=A0ABZ1CR30_9TREE|nr:hypothetical protein IL334_001121 [Kwoniella shivajii]